MAKEDPVAQIIFLVAMAIVFLPLILFIVSSVLKPVFIMLTIFSIIAIMTFGFMLIIEQEEEFTIPLVIAIVVLLISSGGWVMTASVIDSVPQTTEGKEQIEMYNTITEVPNTVSDSLNDALYTTIEEMCKTTDEDICNLMRTTIKTQEDLMEIRGLLNKGKKYTEIAEKIK